jgi:2,4-dienoyl-CoA reductase-like NADH-dependent reductase (Old Yellow Enzyme family)
MGMVPYFKPIIWGRPHGSNTLGMMSIARGAAMVITGAVMGTKLASEFVWGRNLYCFHQGHQQGLSLLTDRIHYFGSLACAQMTMGFGRRAFARLAWPGPIRSGEIAAAETVGPRQMGGRPARYLAGN